MGPKPNKSWGSKPEDAPPSMSSILSQAEIDSIMKYDKVAEDLKAWNRAMKAYYYHRKEQFEMLPDTENEIIMLGNSITDQCEWHELFGNINVKNRGIGGDDTDGVLERLDEVTKSKPAKIFVMIGTNDLAYGKTTEHVIENYKTIIKRIQSASPETKIYIESVLPVDYDIHSMKINGQLKEIVGENNLTYIDLFSVFKTDENKLNPKYSYDGLHLNGQGYMVWKKEIEKFINE